MKRKEDEEWYERNSREAIHGAIKFFAIVIGTPIVIFILFFIDAFAI